MTLRRALGSVLLGAALVGALGGCNATLDSLSSQKSEEAGGADSSAGTTGSTVGKLAIPATLRPVTHSGTYYNAFSDLLGKDNPEVSDKIEAAFQQLFHGDRDTQSIFIEGNTGPDLSSIYDVLHNKQIRTEGMGLAMLITVELDHQEEFDQLWRYSKTRQQETSGPEKGYFDSQCGEGEGTDCYDVYGMQYFALALMLAHGRWHSTPDMPYQADALALLDMFLNKEATNSGVVNGIGNAFSRDRFLVREEPTLADAGFTTRASLQMPAAYWYWAKATGMPFWNAAAKASHSLLVDAADPATGLWPMRSYFDGAPVEGSPGFTQQGYRTQLALALDALWGTASADQAELANRVLNFFDSQGIADYGGTFETDGTPVDTGRAQALVSVNGALAVAARSNPHRKAFVQEVWDQATPSGDNRYYEGLLYLVSMLILSGQLQVY